MFGKNFCLGKKFYLVTGILCCLERIFVLQLEFCVVWKEFLFYCNWNFEQEKESYLVQNECFFSQCIRISGSLKKYMFQYFLFINK